MTLLLQFYSDSTCRFLYLTSLSVVTNRKVTNCDRPQINSVEHSANKKPCSLMKCCSPDAVTREPFFNCIGEGQGRKSRFII